MALNRFRLPLSGAAAVSPAFQSYTHTQVARLAMPTTDGTTLSNNPYAPDAADHHVDGDSMYVQYTTDALTTGTVFDVGNTVKLAAQCFESNAGNNLTLQLWVGVYSNDGSTLRATLRGKVANATEMATSLTNRFISSTVASAYTTVAGDRLVIEISATGTPTAAGGVNGHNFTLRLGSNGAGGDLPENDTETGTTFNPWFEIESTDGGGGGLSIPIASYYYNHLNG